MLITKLKHIRDSINYDDISLEELIENHKQLIQQLIDAYTIVHDIREFNLQLYTENYALKKVVGIPVQPSEFLN